MAAHKGRKRRGGDHEEEHADERWLLTYSDMITLLMALFMVMWSMSTVNQGKFDALSVSLREAFSGKILPGGEAVVLPGSASKAEQAAPEPPVPTIMPIVPQTQGDGKRSDAQSLEREELEKLKREIDQWVEQHGLARQVKTEIARRGLVVTVLTDKVLFDSGSADVKEDRKSTRLNSSHANISY